MATSLNTLTAHLTRSLRRSAAPTLVARTRLAELSSFLRVKGLAPAQVVAPAGGGFELNCAPGYLSVVVTISASGRATYSTLDTLTARVERLLKRADNIEIATALADDLRLPARLTSP